MIFKTQEELQSRARLETSPVLATVSEDLDDGDMAYTAGQSYH